MHLIVLQTNLQQIGSTQHELHQNLVVDRAIVLLEDDHSTQEDVNRLSNFPNVIFLYFQGEELVIHKLIWKFTASENNPKQIDNLTLHETMVGDVD
jgi:hypothetical protein